MNQLRPFAPRDIPEVVALKRLVFSKSAQQTEAALSRYYRLVFFENPWRDERYPSFVQEDSNGAIVGFCGAIPRPMLLGAERLTAVTATDLMVAPEARGSLVGLKMLRRLFDGPQDLTFSDRSNEAGRILFEGLGGSAALWYSLYWSVSLDGSALSFDTTFGGGTPNLVVRAIRLASRLLDRVTRGSITQDRIPTRDEPLTAETVITLMRRLAAKNLLVPEYDDRSFAWLMQRLAEARRFKRVLSAHVAQDAESVGFFIYGIRPDNEVDVVQLAALPGREGVMFDHLTRHALDNGGKILHGRLDRRFARLISERRLPFTLAQPWAVVQSDRPDVTAQLLNGNAVLSRLDSEWWINA